MYLIDTNIWLELLLDQEKAEEVHRFFQQVEGRRLAMLPISGLRFNYGTNTS